MSLNGLIRLKAAVQNYDWGKKGSESLVASFGYSGSGVKIDKERPYAELWVGTHPNGPSSLFLESGGDGGSLSQFLKENPSALDSNANGNSSSEEGLCFLFKILSVAKALSIQAHPTKSRGQELFRDRPDLYKDPNHKPEMACALTEFEALLGFERIETIIENLESTPELRDLVLVDGGEVGSKVYANLAVASSSSDVTVRKDALRAFFATFMASDSSKVATRVDQLISRLTSSQQSPTGSPALKKERIDAVDALAVRLHQQFPHDVGVFCSYVMCYRKLAPGQAVFLAANEPHAYLSGDCVEIMANSDNVIRAALTPKFKDLGELERMLTYNEPPAIPGEDSGWHPCQIMEGKPRDAKTTVFVPPDPEVTEFQLERTIVSDEHVPYVFTPGTYGSVFFVTEGTGEAKWDQGMSRIPLFRGSVFFLPAAAKVSVSGDVVVYRATRRGAI
jgi:mannose-6-phosphate isomerase